MNPLVIVVILLALAGAAYYFANRSKSGSVAAPEPGAKLPSGKPPAEADEDPLQALAKAGAGDAVVFWDGRDALIQCALDCSETVNGRATAWRWLILDDGGLLELAPDGNTHYTETTIFHQGSEEFELFTAEAEDGGLLKLFEERVRAGHSARQPVTFEYHENTYQVRSTGIFAATPRGDAPKAEVWRDISDDPSQNVYFEMTTGETGHAIGIWTSHILFGIGRALSDTDIRGVYRR